MEITKKLKTTPKNIEMLYEIGGNINLKYYEAIDFYGFSFNDYQFENEKFIFKCVFRVPDELADEVKKVRGFNGIWSLYRKYNKENIKRYAEEEIKKHEEEIKKLKKLLD